MALSFETQGKVTLAFYVKLAESDWNVAILMQKDGPGALFYRTRNGLQIMDHMRDINAPTRFGQKLADLLSPIEQIKYLHYNTDGNFIQIDLVAEYTAAEKIAEAIEKVKEIVEAFDQLIKEALIS